MPQISEDLSESEFDEAFGGGDDVLPLPMPSMQMPMSQAPQMPMPQARPAQMPVPRPQPAPQQRPMPQQRPALRSLPQPQQRPMPQMPQQMNPYLPQPLPVLPLPPGLGQAEEPFLQRKVGGLPVWMWGLIVAGGGTAAYFVMREKKDESKSASSKAAIAKTEPKRLERNKSSDWSPSRGRFVDALSKKFSGKFEKVYDDADEAKASFKTVSPLINVKAKPGYQIDKAFESFCKADGLHPVMHDDNEIGIYPADGTAKGREWEEYVDALRDDGQTV